MDRNPFLAALALSLCCATPAFSQVTSTQNPLVARYMVSLPLGSDAFVEFGPDTKYGFATSAVSATAPVIPIFVAGMKQNSTYHMRAVITRANGTRMFDSDHVFHTGAAPASRVPSTTLVQPPGVSPFPGVELVCLNPLPNNPGNFLRVVALNPAGDLIWYYDFDPDLGTAQPIKLLPNGHLLMVLFGGTTGPGGMVREINLAGETIREFTVERLNQWLSASGYALRANAIHHDIAPLPNRHTMVLVNTHKQFKDLPGRPGVTTVLGDAIVDLDLNYNPVWVWSSFDHLDVNRHPMLFPDWTHTNSILYSPDDGNVVLSLRNQSWLIKIDYSNGRGTGNILWKLGYQGDFTLLNSRSPSDWFFAQHFASFMGPKSTGNFGLALFDNGNNRFPDFTGTICPSNAGDTQHSWPVFFGMHVPDCYSRAANFAIDESARTAQLTWSYPLPYSYWGGVNMQLPNGNMFIDDSSISNQTWGTTESPKRHPLRTVVEGLSILGLVILLFFWRIPAAVLPLLTIPLAVIVAFVPVLGAIAAGIGVLVDGAAAVIGPAGRKLDRENSQDHSRDFMSVLMSGMKRVSRPSFFVLIAIAILFLPLFTPADKPSAQILEITQQNQPQLVWELDINGQESYRTVHLPSLYPGVQWPVQ